MKPYWQYGAFFAFRDGAGDKLLRQLSEEDFRIVVEGDPVVDLVTIEKRVQVAAQRLRPRVVGRRNVGRRENATLKSGIVKRLASAKHSHFMPPRRHKF